MQQFLGLAAHQRDPVAVEGEEPHPKGALEHEQRVVAGGREELVLQCAVEVQLACSLEVVAHVFGHVVGEHGASDRDGLKLGGVLGLQTTSEPEAVEGQRRLVGRLELTEDV